MMWRVAGKAVPATRIRTSGVNMTTSGSYVAYKCVIAASMKIPAVQSFHCRSFSYAGNSDDNGNNNNLLLDVLVCPLTKNNLCVGSCTNELVMLFDDDGGEKEVGDDTESRVIGAAYPLVEGIPCMIPTEGRVLYTNDGNYGNYGKQ